MPESSQKSDERSQLIKYAGRILSARPYFRFKLKEKLYMRAEKLNLENPGQIIDAILDDLEKSGYLNDTYLIEGFIRRQLVKGYGPRLISLKLAHLGMERHTINDFLQKYPSRDEELEAIKRYRRKYARLDTHRLISKLITRGFSSNLVRKLFDGDWIED